MAEGSVAEARECGQMVAESSPAAAGVLVAAMESNRRQAEWLDRTILESTERERDEWRRRAETAEARLARIEDRLWSVLS